MTYSIRQAKPTDYEAIMELIYELAAFQNEKQAVVNTPEQMRQEQNYFNCLIAVTNENQIIGMAIYYYTYYTWVGKSLYLDDLVVKKEFRNKGIGTQLLGNIIDMGKSENCKRIRWQVSSWNKPAITLYKKMGAKIDETTFNCDIKV